MSDMLLIFVMAKMAAKIVVMATIILKKAKMIAQSSKSNLVHRTQILGSVGPPKKLVNFDICNKRQKWVFCDSVNLIH